MATVHPGCEDPLISVRVGLDTLPVIAVEQALDTHAERYLQRVYTARERQDCTTSAGVLAPERLAARFAAKEATIKVLRPDDEPVPWRTIEIVRDPGGWVDLVLSGVAAELAARQGILSLAVSLTHEARSASALVVGEVRADTPPG